ncbi:putative cytochrome P450 [Tricladium varicosporioides]|nr:putative cytochrome P450 [Hymenoscyphus varicosporioides]
MALSNTLSALAVLLATGLSYVVFVTYQHRSRINALRKQGIPMPEGWSWIFGHSLTLLKWTKDFPPDANISIPMEKLGREFASTEVFLLDLWPSYPATLNVYNPEAAVLVSQKYNLPKSKLSRTLIEPIVGGESLISMNGGEWKTWRGLFNPGFSAGSLMGHVPFIVGCVEVFCEKLKAEARDGGFVLLDELVTRLTFDVIMKVTLDADVNYQRSEHVLATSLNTITRWHSFWDPRILMHPLRPFVQGYHGKVIKDYVRKELEKRFVELKEERKSLLDEENTKAKSIISLALEDYIKENKEKKIIDMAALDDSFTETVTNQIRLFLFAGNDTTSSTIVFVFHILSKHPEVLVQLRKEHDTIFGLDPLRAAAMLKEQPALLNRCQYTLAVVKETLRIYPPAGNQREGVPGVSLPMLDGSSIDTGGFVVILNHQSMHKNSRIWPRPEEFLPERWLVQPGHELYPPNGAYRPFDIGPRICIGQTLTLNEIRIVMIMTTRIFAIKPAYEEWDRCFENMPWRLETPLTAWTRMRKFWGSKGINRVDGDRAYQTEKAGTHPSDGYPCRVSLAK